MCLRVNSGPHIAEKDMIVLKIINHDNSSFHQGFEYKPNKKYPKVNWPYTFNLIGTEIHAGYHSYDISQIFQYYIDPQGDVDLIFTNGHTRWGKVQNFSGRKMVLFVIPKGATYYMGTRNDIVSSEIESLSLKAVRARDLKRYNPKILKKEHR